MQMTSAPGLLLLSLQQYEPSCKQSEHKELALCSIKTLEECKPHSSAGAGGISQRAAAALQHVSQLTLHSLGVNLTGLLHLGGRRPWKGEWPDCATGALSGVVERRTRISLQM